MGKFGKLDAEVARRRDLSANAKVIWGVLRMFENPNNQECFPSQKTLADAAGMNLRTVNKAVAELKKVDLVVMEGTNRNPIYILQPTIDQAQVVDNSVEMLITQQPTIDQAQVEDEPTIDPVATYDRSGTQPTIDPVIFPYNGLKDKLKDKKRVPPSTPPPGEKTKKAEIIRLYFPRPPGREVLDRLKEAGFTFDDRDRSWWAPHTPDRQAIADAYQDQVLPSELQPKILEYSGPDPGPPLEMPPTDDRLQAVFDHLEEQLRPQTWRTWFAPAAMTLEDNQVVFWTTGEETGRYIQEQYLNPLLQAFEEVHGKVPDKPIQFRVPDPEEVTA